MTLGTDRYERIHSLGYDYTRQTMVEVTSCNLCGGQRFITLVHRDRYGFPAKANACLQCGLVFLNPVMTPEAYKEFYASVYRPLVSAYHGRRIDADTIQEEQQVYAQNLAAFLAPSMPANKCSTLLDIGGSTGVVAHYLAKQFGLAATVLDPAPLEIECAQQLGLETIVGLIEDFRPDGRTFNVITLCQTIDHLLDVAATLDMIRRILSPSGIFFVDIVDFRAAYLRNWSIEEAVKIDHPYYLTEATIKAYLIRFGFDYLKKNYASDHLHIRYVCQLGVPRSDYVPSSGSTEMLREVRMVQNTTHDGVV